MNRNLLLALAVSGALAGLAGGAYAEGDDVYPKGSSPELIAEGDGAFPEGSRSNPELTA